MEHHVIKGRFPDYLCKFIAAADNFNRAATCAPPDGVVQIIQLLQKGQPFILAPIGNGGECERIAVVGIVEVNRERLPIVLESITHPPIRGCWNGAALANVCLPHHVSLYYLTYFPLPAHPPT